MNDHGESPVTRARAAYNRSNFEHSKSISLDYVKSTQQSHHHRPPSEHSCFQLSACLLLAIKSWATIANDTKLEQHVASVEEDLLPATTKCNSFSSSRCLLSNVLPADLSHIRFNGSLKSFYDLVAEARLNGPLVSLLSDPLILLRLCELCLDAGLYDYALNFSVQLHLAASRDAKFSPGPGAKEEVLFNGGCRTTTTTGQSDIELGDDGEEPAAIGTGEATVPPTGISECLWHRLVELYSTTDNVTGDPVNSHQVINGNRYTSLEGSQVELSDSSESALHDHRSPVGLVNHHHQQQQPFGDECTVGDRDSLHASAVDKSRGDPPSSRVEEDNFEDLSSIDPEDDFLVGEDEEDRQQEEMEAAPKKSDDVGGDDDHRETYEFDRLMELMVPASLDMDSDDRRRRQFELLVGDGEEVSTIAAAEVEAAATRMWRRPPPPLPSSGVGECLSTIAAAEQPPPPSCSITTTTEAEAEELNCQEAKEASETEILVSQRKSILKVTTSPSTAQQQSPPSSSSRKRVRFSLDKNHPSPAVEAIYGGRSNRCRYLNLTLRRQRGAELTVLADDARGGNATNSMLWPLTSLFLKCRVRQISPGAHQLRDSTPLVTWSIVLFVLLTVVFVCYCCSAISFFL